MTVIRPNSISGITSITAQANEINVFRSNGLIAGLNLNGVNFNTTAGISTLAALKITGNLDVAGVLTYQDVTNVDSLGIGTFRTGINVSGGQLDVGSNIKLGNAGVITATSFVGSGANLTGLPAETTINGNTDHYVVTATGTANTLQGESTLLFSNGKLDVTQTTSSSDAKVVIRNSNTPGSGSLRLEFQYGTGTTEGTNRFRFGYVEGYRAGGSNDGGLKFGTKPGNADAPTERLRINPKGQISIKGTTTAFDTTGDLDSLQLYYETDSGQASIGPYSSGGSTHLSFYTNAGGAAATEKLRIKSDSSLLHTRTDNTARYDFEFRNTGGISDGNYGGIYWGQGATGSTGLAALQIAYASTGQPDIVFKTRQGGGATLTDSLRIHKNGDLSMPVVGSKIYTNNSGGNLTIQGGATYPGAAIKLNGGTNGGTGVMHFYAGNSSSYEERMTLTAAGRIGINETSPSGIFHVRSAGNGTADGMYFRTGSSGTGAKFYFMTNDNGDTAKYIQHSAYWTEIGCHSNEGVRFRNGITGAVKFYMNGGAGSYYFAGSNLSDRNLKENIETISTPTIDLIKQVIPKTFNWKIDDNNTPHGGFIAQDMQPLFPKLVSGTDYDESKTDDGDPNDENAGKCNPTGMAFDYNGYTAYLTKAMQELIAKVESLEAEVTALKGS